MTDDFTTRSPRRRAKAKRPRHIPGLWARLALSVAVIGVSVFFAVCLVAKAIKPYQEIRHQRTQLAATLSQSDALASQNAQLERRIAYLKTGDGVASEARKMGYLRPGEYPIVVEGLSQPGLSELSPETSPEQAPSSVAPRVSAPRRFWQHLTGR